jgi:hypothetical protein
MGGTVNAPRALHRACIELVAFLRASATRDPSIKSESMPGYSVTFGDANESGIPPSIARKLDAYRFQE